jgi:molecular chaperone GrpE
MTAEEKHTAEEQEAREPEEQSLEERLEALTAERDEYLDRLQRLAADFDNYRKRAARDQESLVVRAHERLVKELLPILDDLGRALEAAAKHEEAAKRPVRDSGPVEAARGNREVPPKTELVDGVQLVHRALADLLAKEGLAEIETNGRFDPHVHEALLSQPSEAEEGSVIQVIQKGYRLGDRVLRPARVVVAAAPEERVGDDG